MKQAIANMGRSNAIYRESSNELRIGEYTAKTSFRYIPIENMNIINISRNKRGSFIFSFILLLSFRVFISYAPYCFNKVIFRTKFLTDIFYMNRYGIYFSVFVSPDVFIYLLTSQYMIGVTHKDRQNLKFLR
ncbi:hypothetical protein D3C78_1551760 [compost metagenome]